MALKVEYKSELGDLISPRVDRNEPIYNWHSFKHSYSKDLVQTLITTLGLKKEAWLLDPFCGAGTTLLSSKQFGIRSRGFDILPFSVFLSNVKVRKYDEIILTQQHVKLRENLGDHCLLKRASFPDDIPLLNKAFSSVIRSELLNFKAHISQIHSAEVRDFFNLAFLSILESVSDTSRDGAFMRYVPKNLAPEVVRYKFLEKCAAMIGDVIKNNNIYDFDDVEATAALGDARDLETEQEFDAIITSPPYLNRHDYTRAYALEMAFDFITDNNELKKIRYDTLRSHVEARKKFEPDGYIQPIEIKKLVNKIEKNGINNNKVPEMITGYFEDMFLCLKQMKKRLIRRGKIALVVSNVRFSGVNIPVDELLSDIGAQTGLKPKAIWAARKRGNSSQQMKNFERKTSRESIVVWEK